MAQESDKLDRQSAITNHPESSDITRWIISIIFVIILLGITSLANAGTATLTWTAPTTNTDGTPLTDLSGYKIYYGTTTGVYSTTIDAGNVTTTTINNLADNTTYYFAVTAYDAMGNESSYSNEVSKLIATTDVTAPVISGISSGSITANGAIITWNTDEGATSQIEYGTTTAYGSSTTIDSLQVTSHSVTLAGLTALTTYHFRVISQDAAGNTATSPDSTFTTIDVFAETTPPVGSISINSGASFANSTSVTLTLSCSDPGSGCYQMRFSNDGTSWSTWESYTGSKTWTLSSGAGLKTVYVQYKDNLNNVSENFQDTITLDTVAPSGTITVNQGGTYTNNASVTLTLSCSDSVSGCYQMRFSNDGITASPWENNSVSKSWTLTGSDGTKTVYVQYKDSAGNISSSYTDTISLDTTAPSITNIASGNITDSGANISWATNEVATTQIEYGTTITYGTSSTYDSTLLTVHGVTLSGLSASTTYHYRVKSIDSAGNLTISSDNTFIISAPPDITPPVISNVGTINVTTNSATIIWTTDEASTSMVEYGESISYGNSTSIDSNLITSHSVTISGLSPNTPYYFRIHSSDQSGNQVVSSGYNLATMDVPPPDTPSAIRDLRIQAGTATRNSVILEWSATGADGSNGTASSYDLRVSEQKIIDDGISPTIGEINFSNATRISDIPVPKSAGSYEYTQVGNLRTNTAYYFAIKAIDEKNNYSAISNVINDNNYPPQPVTALRNGFTMVSTPLEPLLTDVEATLSGIVGTPVELYSWNSTGIGDGNGDFVLATTIMPGHGYFLKTAVDNAVLNIRGTIINDPSWTIPLQPGWNMIGNPYPQEVVLRNAYVRRINTDEIRNYEDAVAEGWISNAAYLYNGSTYNFEMFTTLTLKTWQGYWIAVLKDGQYELVIYRP